MHQPKEKKEMERNSTAQAQAEKIMKQFMETLLAGELESWVGLFADE
ncbi:hypothetical protein [Paenibacillus lacisoli]|nr:hypothetical protein [Paenibacillus sp. JX-17]